MLPSTPATGTDPSTGSVPRTGTVVLVDAYAPALRLGAAFVEAGCSVVRLRSTPEVPEIYRSYGVDPGQRPSPDWTDLAPEMLVHRGDLAATVAEVAAHRPVAVLPGGELGVELADRISEALGLVTNGTRLSAARRDKHLQWDVVRAAGLRTAEHLLVRGEEQLRRWHQALDRPIVVKPTRSAGNDGVHFCTEPQESVAAYRRLVTSRNVFSEPNEGVTAQELLLGTEYVVNTVSRNGRSRVTDLWRYTKISANGVRHRVNAAVSVPPDAEVRPVLTAYANAVLDALGIRHGPAHHEIMLTEHGPHLIETGARLSGADTAAHALLATGESQVERTVAAYLDPETFLATVEAPARHLRHVAMAFLTSPVSGLLHDYPLLPEVEALESFHGIHLAVRPGQHLPITVDDTTEPAMVSLAHSRREVLDRDLATVGWLDGHGFYRLAVDPVRS